MDFFIAVFGWSTHEAASFLVMAKKMCPPVSEGCVRCVVLFFFVCVCVCVCVSRSAVPLGQTVAIHSLVALTMRWVWKRKEEVG